MRMNKQNMVLKNRDTAVNTEYQSSLDIAIQYALITTKIRPIIIALLVILALLFFNTLWFIRSTET